MVNDMKKILLLLCLFGALPVLILSCNKNSTIEEPDPPQIALDNPSGVYTVKAGHEITITPTVTNGEGASYSWLRDDSTVARTLSYPFSSSSAGQYYVTFRAETPYGKDEVEVRIDVSELVPPVISLIGQEGLKIPAGMYCIFDPIVQNIENATFEWKVDGQVVGTEPTYTFSQTEPKIYTVSLKVTNEDGWDEKSLEVEVTNSYSLTVFFERPGFYNHTPYKPVFTGQPVYLKPVVEGAGDAKLAYYWVIDGKPVSENASYIFTPESPGETEIRVVVTVDETDEKNRKTADPLPEIAGTAVVTVVCTGSESDKLRPGGAGSSPYNNKVYEYIPAPGQFIQDTDLAGFTGKETTLETAVAYAEKRLKNKQFVSLGAFGGYITVGFDHSIENKGTYQGYDFAIAGNQYDGASEPGIVWVMQDANGNGQPDDIWYELKGSEWGKAETDAEYAVTYYRPSGIQQPVAWADNRGNTGTVDYLGQFHDQPYYYPAWIEHESYTLRGPRLEARNRYESNKWVNGSYDWGYADNWGSDRLGEASGEDGDARNIYFNVSNAVLPDGTPANLQYIDFIKVQTAVQAQSGWTGELSTEVMAFRDMNL